MAIEEIGAEEGVTGVVVGVVAGAEVDDAHVLEVVGLGLAGVECERLVELLKVALRPPVDLEHLVALEGHLDRFDALVRIEAYGLQRVQLRRR